MSDTIFSKIIRGEIPSHKLYEDAQVLAFLDIAPLSPGHAVVIPKEPAVTLDQLSDDSAAALGRVLPRLCRALQAATGTQEFNVLQNNGRLAHQAVDHVHFHIIPKPSDAQGLGVKWPAGAIDHAAAKILAARVRELCGGG
jgi:histidine triad (HIT) family protein